LAAISPQKAAYNRELAAKWKIGFEMLVDQGNRVAGRYGLVWTLPEDLKGVYLKFGIDLAEYNGDQSWTLPLPARLVIDREGIIRWASVSPDYTVRPDPAETLEFLRATKEGGGKGYS